ncbi:hypothetical protein [Streptomyces dysideae]|uniref:Uncharacterized protein n=1 Tax=Streptomyces dysideae TaxID=909626 RepID=A0A124IFT8_9ACTN|nr:hypothetical protein [Streptomyces dysideae]KUO22492.1 hypothetical protein AQJ91_03380 [Streptomyces dysideae]
MTNARERRRAWTVFALAATTAVCGAVWMAVNWEDARGGNGVSVHRETQSPEEIRKYWTPERMREAKPG